MSKWLGRTFIQEFTRIPCCLDRGLLYRNYRGECYSLTLVLGEMEYPLVRKIRGTSHLLPFAGSP